MAEDSEKKYTAVVMDLAALGLIEFKDDVYFRITAKGLEKARIIFNSLPAADRFLVIMAASVLIDEAPLYRSLAKPSRGTGFKSACPCTAGPRTTTKQSHLQNKVDYLRKEGICTHRKIKTPP